MHLPSRRVFAPQRGLASIGPVLRRWVPRIDRKPQVVGARRNNDFSRLFVLSPTATLPTIACPPARRSRFRHLRRGDFAAECAQVSEVDYQCQHFMAYFMYTSCATRSVVSATLAPFESVLSGHDVRTKSVERSLALAIDRGRTFPQWLAFYRESGDGRIDQLRRQANLAGQGPSLFIERINRSGALAGYRVGDFKTWNGIFSEARVVVTHRILPFSHTCCFGPRATGISRCQGFHPLASLALGARHPALESELESGRRERQHR
jgi:hypothetical protein